MDKTAAIRRTLEHLVAIGVGESVSAASAQTVEGVMARVHATLVKRNPNVTWTISDIPDECAESFTILVASLLTGTFKTKPETKQLLISGAPGAEAEIHAFAETYFDEDPVQGVYF